MPSSNLERRLYGRRYLALPLGLQSSVILPTVITNLGTTAVEMHCIPIHDNCLLESIGVAFISSTGTTSALTVQVRRATTVLASATATGTGRTAAVSSEVDAPLTKGEALNLTMLAGTNDDDFLGAVVTLCFAPLKADS